MEAAPAQRGWHGFSLEPSSSSGQEGRLRSDECEMSAKLTGLHGPERRGGISHGFGPPRVLGIEFLEGLERGYSLSGLHVPHVVGAKYEYEAT